MKKRFLIAPLIVIFGLGISMMANAFERQLNAQSDLARAIPLASDRPYDDFVMEAKSPKVYSLTGFAENTQSENVKQIRKRLHDRGFIIIEERTPSSHGAGRFLCQGYGDDGVLIFEKMDNHNSYIALNYGYKWTLSGCQFSVTQMVTLDLKEVIRDE